MVRRKSCALGRRWGSLHLISRPNLFFPVSDAICFLFKLCPCCMGSSKSSPFLDLLQLCIPRWVAVVLLLFTATLWKKKPGEDAVLCFPQHGSKAKHCRFISLTSRIGSSFSFLVFLPTHTKQPVHASLQFLSGVGIDVLLFPIQCPRVD